MEQSVNVQIQLEIKGSRGTKARAKAIIRDLLGNSQALEKSSSELYELQMHLSGEENPKSWKTSDLNLLTQHMVVELQKFIDQHYNPNTDSVSVLEDSAKLLELRSGYCQHCKKKIIEYYGFCHGVVKKCKHCRKLTVIKDEEWKEKWNRVA